MYDLNLVPEKFLRELFAQALAAADPIEAVTKHLPKKPSGNIHIIGAGKASARMAEAVEAKWGDCKGMIITRYGYARPVKTINIIEASHPVPDDAGYNATKKMLDLVSGLGKDDFVLALISGGASALLTAPLNGMSLDEKKHLNQMLLDSGAPIGEMNVVRKHLSLVKGGQLAAAAYPANMLTLIISDVPGDDPASVGSGPTVGDNSTAQDAIDILEKWKIEISSSAKTILLNTDKSGEGPLSPDDIRLSNAETKIIAAPMQSLNASAIFANELNFEIQLLGDAIEGEARVEAARQAKIAIDIKAKKRKGDRPILLLSGGELTVTKSGKGIGGPNAEFCLALAIALNGAKGIHAIACDTDGVDGGDEVAGAVISPDTLTKAKKSKLNLQDELNNNNAHSFFKAIDSQVITGPTLTNVNDFRAILIL